MHESTRNASDSVGQCSHAPGAVEVPEQLLARDVMQCGVVSLEGKEPVQKAIALLIERSISGLPVTEEGRLVGVLSEKDLLRLLYETRYFPGLVEDYMTCGPDSFDVETRLEVIHRHLVEQSFRHAPILLQGRLAGIITRADLVRVYKEKFRPSTQVSAGNDGEELLAEDAMRCGLLTVHPDAPLYDAMDTIARHRVTGLPVIDEDLNLLGIITEKDVLDCVDKPEAVGASVGAFMTQDVMAFDRKAGLMRICLCLIENDFHRVPILDGRRLVGIVSRSDILRFRAAVFKC